MSNYYDAGAAAFDGTESTEEELKKMVLTFRVHELQHLLGFGNRCKLGKKNDLLSRAVEFVRTTKSLQVQQKVRELYRRRFPDYGFASQLPDLHSVPPPPSYSFSGPPSTAYCSRSNHRADLSPPPPPPLYANPMSLTFQRAGPTSTPSGVSFSGYRGANASGAGSTSTMKLLDALSCANVRFAHLPFYDVIGTLVKPTMLRTTNPNSKFQENYMAFSLNQQQMQDITYQETEPLPRIEVQLRFCNYDTSVDQKDEFPCGLEVRINEKLVVLPNLIPTNKPGVEPKRPSRPVNVSPHCRNSQPQRMNIFWAANNDKSWVVAVFLVRRLTSTILLKRLQLTTPFSAEHSKKMIKSCLADDNDISTMSLRVSLQCPIGKMRMQVPCRLKQCKHLQCFDADLFLRMNEKKPTWMCPVCDKPTPFEDLVVDDYFSKVLANAPRGVSEVELLETAEWVAVKDVEEDEGESDAEDADLASLRQNGQGGLKTPEKNNVCEPILLDADESPVYNPRFDRQPPPLSNVQKKSPARASRHAPSALPSSASSSASSSSSAVARRLPPVNYRGNAINSCRSQSSWLAGKSSTSVGCGNAEILIDLTGDSDDDDDFTTVVAALSSPTKKPAPPLTSNLASATSVAALYESQGEDDGDDEDAAATSSIIVLDSPPTVASTTSLALSPPSRLTASTTPPDDPAADSSSSTQKFQPMNGGLVEPNSPSMANFPVPPSSVSDLLNDVFLNAGVAASSSAPRSVVGVNRRKRQRSTAALDLTLSTHGVDPSTSMPSSICRSDGAISRYGVRPPFLAKTRSTNFFRTDSFPGYIAATTAPHSMTASLDPQFYYNAAWGSQQNFNATSAAFCHQNYNNMTSSAASPSYYPTPTSSSFSYAVPSPSLGYGGNTSSASATGGAKHRDASMAATMTTASFYGAGGTTASPTVAPHFGVYQPDFQTDVEKGGPADFWHGARLNSEYAQFLKMCVGAAAADGFLTPSENFNVQPDV